MSTIECVTDLLGKTISEAAVVTTENGDQEVIIRCTDGTAYTIGAWQEEGYPVRMAVTPND